MSQPPHDNTPSDPDAPRDDSDAPKSPRDEAASDPRGDSADAPERAGDEAPAAQGPRDDASGGPADPATGAEELESADASGEDLPDPASPGEEPSDEDAAGEQRAGDDYALAETGDAEDQFDETYPGYDEAEYDYGDEDWQDEQFDGEHEDEWDDEWEDYEDYEYDEYEEEDWEDFEEEEEEDDGQEKMTLIEHLEELRKRLILAALGLAGGVAVALALSPKIIAILSAPLKDVTTGDSGLITTAVVDPFSMYLRISLYIGIIIASPWLFTQAWLFIAAGLYEEEKRYVRWAVPFSAALFIGGALFFLLVVSHPILKFFHYFSTQVMGVKFMITLKNHITFMTNMMIVFGLCFQTPIAVLLLAKMGLVTVHTLHKYRRYVIVVMFIVAAFCTSPSPLDQAALALPMWLLYELGVIMAYFMVERPRRREEAAYQAQLAAEEQERA